MPRYILYIPNLRSLKVLHVRDTYIWAHPEFQQNSVPVRN